MTAAGAGYAYLNHIAKEAGFDDGHHAAWHVLGRSVRHLRKHGMTVDETVKVISAVQKGLVP